MFTPGRMQEWDPLNFLNRRKLPFRLSPKMQIIFMEEDIKVDTIWRDVSFCKTE